MEPFATVEDYEARYGEVEDRDRVETLLGDATAFIEAQPGFRYDAGDFTQAANLTRICCAVVYRSLAAGDLAGLSSYSQGAVGYTSSVSVYNPSGDFFLTASERKALGMGSGMIGQTDPYGVRGGCRRCSR